MNYSTGIQVLTLPHTRIPSRLPPTEECPFFEQSITDELRDTERLEYIDYHNRDPQTPI
jgi:hypothetical protein